MKTTSLFLLAGLVFTLLFTQCAKDEGGNNNLNSIVPSTFKVDIPDAISHTGSTKATKSDTISGEEIYEMLALFIAVGEGSADIVQGIMNAIQVYGINKPMSLSYEGDDDGKQKNLTVVENSTYEGTDWMYELKITDAASEGNADGGIGIQVFWNNNPVKGVAILKPMNMNTSSTEDGTSIYKIDYSEAGEAGYDAHMIVSIIVDTTLVDDQFEISQLKMFVGKKGDVVDVYGNTNHPNATIFTDNAGFNWAFVASGLESSDLGVAEVGLPPSTLDATSRTVLLETYSVKQVLTDEITEYYIEETGIAPDSTSLAGYLRNADAPAYFDGTGFVAAGTSPSSDYNVLETQIDALTPYNPKDIMNLTIEFKK